MKKPRIPLEPSEPLIDPVGPEPSVISTNSNEVRSSAGDTIPSPPFKDLQATGSTGDAGTSTEPRRARAEEIFIPSTSPPPLKQPGDRAQVRARPKRKRVTMVAWDQNSKSKPNESRPPLDNTESDVESDTTTIEAPDEPWTAPSNRTQSKVLAAGMRKALKGKVTADDISLLPSFRRVSATDFGRVASFIERRHGLIWRRHRVWQGRISTVFGTILKVRRRPRVPLMIYWHDQAPSWRKKPIHYIGKADRWTYFTLMSVPRLRCLVVTMEHTRYWRGVDPLGDFDSGRFVWVGREAYHEWLGGAESIGW
ncbi:hypothetical protein GGTG_07545 [Gaeumannomyces tritici R3-111a-1]|uniref:Uncharacterized protein n=1 Tax=Gaeumannomyces tritici (strain R3-111a-1) TaxID=644352 RepID=J3P1Z7_GAET3|nr:hypothetical protein GGTG_07545 [Gaeumannomyces tritici R3-111a-1]EJT73689.1 hypothetical protein GGTG_07545 [Gaeumannomyces tritici R3-111a-1]